MSTAGCGPNLPPKTHFIREMQIKTRNDMLLHIQEKGEMHNTGHKNVEYEGQ